MKQTTAWSFLDFARLVEDELFHDVVAHHHDVVLPVVETEAGEIIDDRLLATAIRLKVGIDPCLYDELLGCCCEPNTAPVDQNLAPPSDILHSWAAGGDGEPIDAGLPAEIDLVDRGGFHLDPDSELDCCVGECIHFDPSETHLYEEDEEC